MRNKKGMEMAISTIILIVLGIFVLVGLMFMLVTQFGFFKDNAFGGGESNVDSVVKGCNLLVESEQEYSYCCDVLEIKTSDVELELTCFESFSSAWAGERISHMDCSSVVC